MYLVSFYAPLDQADKVKEAMFAAGAGRIGAYEACAWQTHGRGQFRPLAGSHPFIGQDDKLEFVDEVKVEMVCQDGVVRQVIEALKRAHPYETPAYAVVRCEDI